LGAQESAMMTQIPPLSNLLGSQQQQQPFQQQGYVQQPLQQQQGWTNQQQGLGQQEWANQQQEFGIPRDSSLSHSHKHAKDAHFHKHSGDFQQQRPVQQPTQQQFGQETCLICYPQQQQGWANQQPIQQQQWIGQQPQQQLGQQGWANQPQQQLGQQGWIGQPQQQLGQQGWANQPQQQLGQETCLICNPQDSNYARNVRSHKHLSSLSQHEQPLVQQGLPHEERLRQQNFPIEDLQLINQPYAAPTLYEPSYDTYNLTEANFQRNRRKQHHYVIKKKSK